MCSQHHRVTGVPSRQLRAGTARGRAACLLLTQAALTQVQCTVRRAEDAPDQIGR
jgi:hypothetical protein